jgi:hypothetical protein
MRRTAMGPAPIAVSMPALRRRASIIGPRGVLPHARVVPVLRGRPFGPVLPPVPGPSDGADDPGLAGTAAPEIQSATKPAVSARHRPTANQAFIAS